MLTLLVLHASYIGPPETNHREEVREEAVDDGGAVCLDEAVGHTDAVVDEEEGRADHCGVGPGVCGAGGWKRKPT